MAPVSDAEGSGRSLREPSKDASGQPLRLTPFLVTVIMIVVTGALWLVLNPSAQQARDLGSQVARLRREVAELERQHDELEAWRDGLKYNPLVIEREARRQLGRVRPGEAAVVYEWKPASTPLGRAAASSCDSHTRIAIYSVLGLLALTVPALFVSWRCGRRGR